MTPEDIEQLKRLKALFDDGVLTTEEFELQKRGLLSSPDRRVDAPWSIEDIELDEGFIVHAADDVYRREAADDDYRSGRQSSDSCLPIRFRRNYLRDNPDGLQRRLWIFQRKKTVCCPRDRRGIECRSPGNHPPCDWEVHGGASCSG